MGNYRKHYAQDASILHDNVIDSLCPTFNGTMLTGLPYEEYQNAQKEEQAASQSTSILAHLRHNTLLSPCKYRPCSHYAYDHNAPGAKFANLTMSGLVSMGTTLKETDTIRLGSNNKLYHKDELRAFKNQVSHYFKNKDGGVLKNKGGHSFRGNAHVSTTKISAATHKVDLGAAGHKLEQVAAPVGYAADAVQIIGGIKEDNGKFGCNAQRATAGAAGKKILGKAGAKSGAKVGALVGAKVGVWFFGAGAVPGAAIGAVVGGVVGGIAGGRYGGKMGKKAYNDVSNYNC